MGNEGHANRRALRYFTTLLFFTALHTKGNEQKVLEDLSQLKAQMRWLVGNGHPGKLKELEDRVERHEQFVNRVGGISAFVATVITLLHVGIDYLKVNGR